MSVDTDRHILTIEPDVGYDGPCLRGKLVTEDGTEYEAFLNDRARVIAWAQGILERHYARKENLPTTERLVLNHVGEIMCEPSEHSVKV